MLMKKTAQVRKNSVAVNAARAGAALLGAALVLGVVQHNAHAQAAERSGKDVVDATCASCHATGEKGAPKIGDKGAWAKHIGGGLEHLTQNAIKGIRQMPARGGNPDLSDIEVTRAIVYMANQSGASFKEPEAKPAAKTPADSARATTTSAAK